MIYLWVSLLKEFHINPRSNKAREEPPDAVGWSELWLTCPLMASYQDDIPNETLLEHIGLFSSLNKKLQRLHDARAGTSAWNREHFDLWPDVNNGECKLRGPP